MLGLMHFQNIRRDINKAASAVSIWVIVFVYGLCQYLNIT